MHIHGRVMFIYLFVELIFSTVFIHTCMTISFRYESIFLKIAEIGFGEPRFTYRCAGRFAVVIIRRYQPAVKLPFVRSFVSCILPSVVYYLHMDISYYS